MYGEAFPLILTFGARDYSLLILDLILCYLKMDGTKRFLDEIIADNGGIKQAFQVFKVIENCVLFLDF